MKRDKTQSAIEYGLYLLETFGHTMTRDEFKRILNGVERRMGVEITK